MNIFIYYSSTNGYKNRNTDRYIWKESHIFYIHIAYIKYISEDFSNKLEKTFINNSVTS